MKVVFIMHDLLTWPRQMIEHLQGHEIVLLDNGSTYEPLLRWYKDECPHRVLYMENMGHLSPWEALSGELRDQPYVVTDPDLDISRVPKNWAATALKAMKITGETKVGLSIDTSAIPADSPARARGKSMRFDGDLTGAIIDGVPILSLPVDTTFAVYAPGRKYAMDGISLGRPYTALHLPWHHEPDEEYRYYIEHANASSQYSTYLRGLRG